MLFLHFSTRCEFQEFLPVIVVEFRQKAPPRGLRPAVITRIVRTAQSPSKGQSKYTRPLGMSSTKDHG